MEQDSNLSIVEAAPYALAKRAQEAGPYGIEPADEGPGLIEYWRVLQKRRMAILTLLFIVFTIALVATLKEKRVYEAKALIEVQRENPDIPTLQDLFHVENISDSYLETQYHILKSDGLARSVISQLKLAQTSEFESPSRNWLGLHKAEATPPPIYGLPASSTVRSSASNEALKAFQKRLDVEPIARSRLIQISFESHDAALAAQIVNTLAANFIQQNLEARWEASQNASKWLGKQLLEMKAQLEHSENTLQEYARTNGLLFLETDSGKDENIVAERLREIQDELTKAQADLYEKESLYRLVQNGDFASLPGVFDNKLMQDLTEKLAELQSDRSQLSANFNPAYPRMKEVQNQIDEIEAVLSQQRQTAAETITRNYKAAVDHESMLQGAFAEQQREANLIAEKSVKYNILKREADTNKDLYVGLLQKLNQTEVSNSLKAANIRIVDLAYPPKKPVRPNVFLNLSLALAFGLCLGIAGAFVQEHLDNTFKTTQEIEQYLHLPALGCIPALETSNGYHRLQSVYGHARLLLGEKQVTDLAPHWNRIEGNGHNPALIEAFHGLRTSVLLSTARRPPATMLVTSAQGGEGKTTVAANLAISLAQLGERVLLIDADLRRPSVHTFFDVSNTAGLVHFLTGSREWRSLLHPLTSPNLNLLVCGPVPPNPVDLLASENMRTLIRDASREYNFVVLDSPPLLNLADSRILATLVDATVLVVRGGHTPRDLVQRAYASVLETGCRVLGATFNFADTRFGYYSYSYPAEKNGRKN